MCFLFFFNQNYPFFFFFGFSKFVRINIQYHLSYYIYSENHIVVFYQFIILKVKKIYGFVHSASRVVLSSISTRQSLKPVVFRQQNIFNAPNHATSFFFSIPHLEIIFIFFFSLIIKILQIQNFQFPTTVKKICTHTLPRALIYTYK